VRPPPPFHHNARSERPSFIPDLIATSNDYRFKRPYGQTMRYFHRKTPPHRYKKQPELFITVLFLAVTNNRCLSNARIPTYKRLQKITTPSTHSIYPKGPFTAFQNGYFFYNQKHSTRFHHFNPLPPSDAVRKQKKNILEDLFSSVLSYLKKY